MLLISAQLLRSYDNGQGSNFWNDILYYWDQRMNRFIYVYTGTGVALI